MMHDFVARDHIRTIEYIGTTDPLVFILARISNISVIPKEHHRSAMWSRFPVQYRLSWTPELSHHWSKETPILRDYAAFKDSRVVIEPALNWFWL